MRDGARAPCCCEFDAAFMARGELFYIALISSAYYRHTSDYYSPSFISTFIIVIFVIFTTPRLIRLR